MRGSLAFQLAFLMVAPVIGAYLGCVALEKFARRRRILDLPNERSLHTAPKPRLGGVAIVLSSWISVAIVWVGSESRALLLPWMIWALPIAVLGLVDDLRPLKASLRIVVQFAAAAAFCVTAGVPRTLVLTTSVSLHLPYILSLVLLVIWLVGVLNIFNFMDGMDGLAGTQTLSGGLAIAVAAWIRGNRELAFMNVAIAAASAGFLLRNKPPASIFMGDAGSTYLGFSFASALILGADESNPVPIFVAPLALAPFLFDGTFTITRRALNREPIWKAHRSHLYQRAVQTNLSHAQVLRPYAWWCALAAAGAIAAAQGGNAATLAAIAAMVIALVLVWRWVVAREARFRELPSS